MAEDLWESIRGKSNSLKSMVQGYFLSVTDMAEALAKQKLLQMLISSGVIQTEHIRNAIQIGE